MPYYISDQNESCSGWAVEKDDGEVIGCHQTKQDAIDQMVAVSIAEDMEPGGERQVELDLPSYIREAASQGLEFYEDGLGGDGLVERTIREARAMARGEISEDKVIRVSAWAARHEPDLSAEGAKPGEDGYPTPGAVAHLLWGIPTGGRYADARAWFDRKAEQVKEEQGRASVPPVEPRTKDSGVEFREFTAEMRATGDGNTFVGYAARFNSDSQPLPFIERIMPGAFAKTLRSKRDVRLFINHDSGQVLASKRSGTLRLEEDEKGLRVEADLPDTQAARDLKELMRRGVVDSMSFGFTVPRGGDRWSEDGRTRELREVTLHEVSVVTGFPAYEATSAAVRSLEAVCERTGMSVDEIAEVLQRLADKPADAPAASPNLIELKRRQAELAAKKVV